MPLAPLTTATKVATKSAVEEPVDGTVDYDSLLQAVDEASAVVYGYLRRDSISALRPSAQAAIEMVATRIASRFWRNPQDQSSMSYNDVSMTFSDPRVLTGDEREALKPYVDRRRDPIPLVPVPPEEDAWQTW